MTALEFYRKHLYALVSTGKTEYKTEPEIFEQAKEMEKEKLKDAYDAGVWDVGCKAPNFDEYYKITFKSE